MTFKFLFIVLVSFLFTNCSQPEASRFGKETKLFKAYLGKNLKVSIDKDTAWYILIPSNACIGCIGGILAERNQFNPRVKIVVSEKALLKSQLDIATSPLLVDTNNGLDKLPFHKGNIGLVRCANSAVYGLESFDAGQIDTLLKSLQRQ